MPASKECSRFAVVPAESSLTFEANSTLHKVHGRADALAGYVEAAWDGDAPLALDPAPRMRVEFNVERLRSGNDLQDREMWKMIDSRRFPLIAAEMREIKQGSAPGKYQAAGDITLAGRVRRYDGEMRVTHDGDGMLVEGDLVVDIRDFGLRPPNLLIIRVDPQVKVHLHLVAAPAA